MITLHPEYLIKDGKKEFVILSYEEFLKIEEMISDYEDLTDLRVAKAKEENAPSISLEQAKLKLGL